MKRFAVMLVCVGLLAGNAWAGIISRTTIFETGQIISASQMNTEIDTAYNAINGSLQNVNIADDAAITYSKLDLGLAILNADVAAAAAILPSKLAQTAAGLDADIVDDYSNDEAEQDNTSDPGTSGNETLATNLQIELEQIRFKLHQLGLGTSSGAVAAAGETNATSTWIDGPPRAGNLIYNGGFDVLQTLATDADGDGWVRVQTPTTLAAIALVEDEGNGHGQAIQIIDTDVALAGIKQTLNGLKAGTKYQVIARVQDDLGKCRIVTTGADTNQLTVDSDDTGNWQTISGTFETDGTPTDVVIQLLAVAQSDNCTFNFVGVYEINTDPIPRAGHIISEDTSASGHTITGVAAVIAGLSTEITVPGPGYIIRVDYMVNIAETAGVSWQGTLQVSEESSGVGQLAHIFVISSGDSSGSGYYYNPEPTPGTTYTYEVEADEISGGTGVACENATFPCMISAMLVPVN